MSFLENLLLFLMTGAGSGVFASLVSASEVVQPLVEPSRVRFGADTPWGGISICSVRSRRAAHIPGEAGGVICTDFQLRKRSHLKRNRIPQTLLRMFSSYQGGGKAKRPPRSI